MGGIRKQYFSMSSAVNFTHNASRYGLSIFYAQHHVYSVSTWLILKAFGEIVTDDIL